MPQFSDEELRDALSPGRTLWEEDAVVQAAMDEVQDRAPKRRMWLSILGALVVLVPTTALAMQAIQAEPGSAGDSFTNYLNGSEPETWPGTPYVGEPPAGPGGPSRGLVEDGANPRVLASKGDLGLFVSVTAGGDAVLFEYPGLGRGMGRDELYEIARDKLAKLGPGGVPVDGLTPLYGLADDEVSTVRMIYATGPPSERVEADGGFILFVDSTRDPQRLEGLSVDGDIVGTTGAGGYWADEAKIVRRTEQKRSP